MYEYNYFYGIDVPAQKFFVEMEHYSNVQKAEKQ